MHQCHKSVLAFTLLPCTIPGIHFPAANSFFNHLPISSCTNAKATRDYLRARFKSLLDFLRHPSLLCISSFLSSLDLQENCKFPIPFKFPFLAPLPPPASEIWESFRHLGLGSLDVLLWNFSSPIILSITYVHRTPRSLS